MIAMFSLADRRVRLCLSLGVVVAFATAALLRHASVHAQTPEQLTIYSSQSNYSASIIDVKGVPYVGLVDVMEPLGTIDARPDGKKYKLRFTPPGGHAVEAQFNEGKDKAKVLGENLKLPANFVLQNGRGYVPLSAVPQILSKLLAKPVQLHAGARRMFIGDVAARFNVELDKSTPPKLVLSFPIAVNPTIATEPGRVRLLFRHEPVVAGEQAAYKFDDSVITGATFLEHDGEAELDVSATAPLLANFADGGKTVIVAAAPPPPAAPVASAPAPPQASQPAAAAPPKPPAAPRFLVIIDPAHGGADNGAAITPSLLEKDVVLALARRVARELTNRGIPAAMLRNSDVAISLDQRALSTNAARPALYISLHAANTGQGVHVFTSLLPAANLSRSGFLPWETAQAAFLDLSGVAAGSVAEELENRKLPNLTQSAPLRPMNNIAAPAIAIEIAPPDDKVENIAGARYEEQVAQSIAAGIAAIRSKLPEVRP